MRQIRQLSSHVADLIAAGEVVERPMSVVKELLENSIDAKSTQITVEIQNGGISYIRITDDGVGMSKNDAPIAFLRHATSKVYEQSDLDSIKTLGFRGEALAAISAVSKIDLFTKRKDDTNATLVTVQAGQVMKISETGANDGTTIIVRDLFYNTPARMKFLKKDYTEASYIVSIVENLAMSNPQIAFKLIKDNKQVLSTLGKGDLKSVIYNVFGKEDTQNLIEIKPYEINGIRVHGYISKPSNCKATRAKQHFFVNGRFVKSRIICGATEEAYKNSVMHGKFPYGVINIEINESLVDVNVHPTKTEVKFSNEKNLFETVYFGVKETINSQNIITEAKISKPKLPDIFANEELETIFAKSNNTEQSSILVEKKQEFKSHKFSGDYVSSDSNDILINEKNFEQKTAPKAISLNPFASAVLQDSKQKSLENNFSNDLELNSKKTTYTTKNIEIPINNTIKNLLNHQVSSDITLHVKSEGKSVSTVVDHMKNEVVDLEKITKPFKIIGECFNTYILCEYENEMILIDKHAAHERINFNKLLAFKDNIESQILFQPLVVSLSAEEYGIFIENLEEINKLGFEIEDFSQKNIIVRQIPMILDQENLEDLIMEISHKLLNNRKLENDKIDDILHSVACKSAIKGNKYTSILELEVLAKEVIFNENVNFCPHGRPVKVGLSKYNIEKMFKRIV